MMNEGLRKAVEARKAAGPVKRPDRVTAGGREYDLTKEPEYRRTYLERLAKIGTAPLKAVRLHCFECSGYSALEAKQCSDRSCALWVLLDNRKRRKAAGGESEEADDTDDLF